MEDKPVKEVAAILEIPAGSVRAYLTRRLFTARFRR